MTTILRLLNAGSGGQPSRNRPLRRRPLLARFNGLGNLPVPTHGNRDLWPSAAFTAGTYLFVVSIIAFSEKGVNSFFVKKWAVFIKILFSLLEKGPPLSSCAQASIGQAQPFQGKNASADQ